MNVESQKGKYTFIKRDGSGGSIVDYLLLKHVQNQTFSRKNRPRQW